MSTLLPGRFDGSTFSVRFFPCFDYPRSCFAVAKWISPSSLLANHSFRTRDNLLGVRTDQCVGPYPKGFRSLRAISECDTENSQDACLLLHSAKVGQNQLCFFF